MTGLIVLVVMIAIAVLAPVLANSRGLNPIFANATPNSGRACTIRSVPTATAGPC